MSIASFLNHTIHVASVTGKDSYGKFTYETPRPIVARVEAQRRMVKRGLGDESVANHRIYTLAPIQATDRIWLPGVDQTQIELSVPVLAVQFSGDRTNSRTLYKTEL